MERGAWCVVRGLMTDHVEQWLKLWREYPTNVEQWLKLWLGYPTNVEQWLKLWLEYPTNFVAAAQLD